MTDPTTLHCHKGLSFTARLQKHRRELVSLFIWREWPCKQRYSRKRKDSSTNKYTISLCAITQQQLTLSLFVCNVALSDPNAAYYLTVHMKALTVAQTARHPAPLLRCLHCIPCVGFLFYLSLLDCFDTNSCEVDPVVWIVIKAQIPSYAAHRYMFSYQQINRLPSRGGEGGGNKRAADTTVQSVSAELEYIFL